MGGAKPLISEVAILLGCVAFLVPGVPVTLRARRPESRGEQAHTIATREWGAFTRSLEDRIPSQAELMEAKLRIDRLVAPYIRRAGLPRSNRPPGKGGPL
jgi:hypothetical protein